MEALRQAGTVADALLTTGLTHVALAGGSWVSYAGLLTLVYYQAETGRVHLMDPGLDVPTMETGPATIPAAESGGPSGRTALVHGRRGADRKFKVRFG